jgi:WD40 repeat protein
MNNATDHSRKFYVVGGPVQPDQACYVMRDADRQLCARLREGDYCCVLAPPHTGKTSLMAQTGSRLRSEGLQVATVDLVDIGSRHVEDDVPRWYYTLAYRIVRDLRIRRDMNTWWQERSGLTIMQRLRDFFLEVVLTELNQPVVIFIDRLESIADQRAAWEFLDAIRACFDARATVPEYRRLAFVLIGETGACRSLPSHEDSPFTVSTPIALKDFGADDLYALARGLQLPPADTARVAERIAYWTGGHPYLTQKVLRALTRRGSPAGDEAAVDEAVVQLFLGRNATRDEPHLALIAAQLGQESPRRVARLSLYGRIRKGIQVVPDRTRREHRELLDSGLVVDLDGRFAVRNRIYAEAFTTYWVNQNLRFGWKGFAAAAMVAILLLMAPVWYTEYLPAASIRVLTSPDEDFVSAQEAWRRLHLLPGFGNTADRLFLDHLVRQSRHANQLTEVQRIGERMAELPDGAPRAQELLAEFWDRRSNAMAQRGERDAALLYRLKSLSLPTRARRLHLGELLGEDYTRLAATIRSAAPLRAVEADPRTGLLVTLDEQHDVAAWRLTGATPRREQLLGLTAEEIAPLQRRVVHVRPRFAKRLTLTARLDHPRPADVEIILRAPSGRQAVLRVVEAARTGQRGEFHFDSGRNWMLLPLLEQSVAGTWSASFADTRQGAAGRLLAWELRLDGETAAPRPDTAGGSVAIPEPQTTRRIGTALGPAGHRALSWPVDPAVRGDLLVWDLARGQVISRLPRPAEFSTARFVLGHSAVLIIGEQEVELREAGAGKVIGRVRLTTPGSGPLVSVGGRYLLTGATARGGANALSLWDLSGLRLLGQLVTGVAADVAAVDPLGRYVAVGDGDRFVRVWAVREQSLVAECEHAARPTAVQFDPQGRWLATEDATHRLHIWDIAAGCRPVLSRSGSGPWLIGFAPESGVLAVGNYGRGFELLTLSAGQLAGVTLQPGMGGAGAAPATPAARPQVIPALGVVLTYDGRKALKIWQAPALSDAAELPVSAEPGPEALAVSPDGRLVAFGTRSGDVRIAPLQTGPAALLGADTGPGFIGHLSTVTRLQFDAAGRLVASGSLEGTLRVWESDSGAPRAFFNSQADGAVQDLAFLPGGRHVVSASRDAVRVTDAATGAAQAQLSIQAEEPRLAVSADGESVFIAGDRDGVTRWDWRTGASVALVGANYRVRRITGSPDGQYLATASADRVVRLWRPEAGSSLRRSFTTGAPVDWLWFADERHLLVQAGSWLHTLSIETAGLVPQVSRLLPEAGALVQSLTSTRELALFRHPFSFQPGVVKVPVDGSWAQPFDDPVEPLTADLQARLRLAINEAGEPSPLE